MNRQNRLDQDSLVRFSGPGRIWKKSNGHMLLLHSNKFSTNEPRTKGRP